MKPLLLIDFGSTYTKVTTVDAETGELYASAQSFTTVEKDISIGLENALRVLTEKCGITEFYDTLACSSAAGGLRMIACGLVPSLTAEAAKRAALGAGAKVIKTFAYEMTEEDKEEIELLKPDIALLCGGTDGGNSACALHNAGVLASVNQKFPVVVACNRSAQAKCVKILQDAGRKTVACENVMPAFGKLNILPCQKVIRDLFLRRIVSAKGLSKAQSLLSEIVMPTPAAVMEALTLLSSVSGVSADEIKTWIEKIHNNPGVLSQSAAEENMDFALASSAIETGLIRHSGTIEQVYTPMGVAYQQTGKDLTRVNRLLLTGGALVHLNRWEEMAKRAMASTACPESLMPRNAEVVLDRHYILSAAGLMAKKYPEAAKTLLGKEFT